MGSNYSQLLPPKPKFTDANVSSLAGKVYFITGGNQGIGYELAKILYSKDATVYIAGRSIARLENAAKDIKEAHPKSTGQIKTLHIDLGDLASIGPGIAPFLAQESRLDVLWLNAGVAQIPAGTVTTQGLEVHMGTNCVGSFLVTQLLLPILRSTAKSTPKNNVRVIFTSSGIVDMTIIPHGINLEELKPGNYNQVPNNNYATSKVGNWFIAAELDKRVRQDGIISITQNPGTIQTTAWDKLNWFLRLLFKPFMYPTVFGAYTELWCGLSEEVTLEDGGRFAIPFGRWHPSPRQDCLDSLKSKADGGTGVAGEFWNWLEEQTKPYAVIRK